jgi:DNA-binding NtrC family response regulator
LQRGRARFFGHGQFPGVERELLVEALKTARGNMARAAQALGISERVIGLRVRKHGIQPKRFSAPPAASVPSPGA